VIILDTNVISELTRPAPDPGVIAWLDSLPAGEAAITAITAAELLYGVRRIPDGRRSGPTPCPRFTVPPPRACPPWPIPAMKAPASASYLS